MPELLEALPNHEEGCRAVVLAELNAGRIRDKALEEKLDENTAYTKEIIEILAAMKGGIKVLGWLGGALKWGAGIAGAVYTIYCIIKGRNPL